ncbi:MAG: asparagine synthase (glutamine-hydrolyzing) [Nanoarchaeota archaeon]|nr:asparagine synthase (glutamine-hydrolyzing) [Nanoarchaeota archaeon]
MCGITGFIGLNDKNKIRRMTNAIVHRGPDDFGYFSDKNIELGNRRLSIIDLSKRGKMPMCNENEDIWITYNGEVYNFQEIRQELEKKGHKFKSNTDTEVILHAYEEYGFDCVKHFNGMFAFAIWDSRKNKKQLFLVRDKIGIKPAYYYYERGKLVFASEIKAILEFGIKREVDKEALSNYLTYTYTPAPLTMFKEVKKLLPGHYLIYKNKKIQIKKYWDFDFNPIQNSEDYYSKLLFKVLKDSVKRHLISDVPVGHYLSGGIDSSSILAMIKIIKKEQEDKSEIKTFSVGFNTENVLDELKYAKLASERFSTEHHEIIVEEDAVKEFPKIIWQMDEPMPNISLIPLWKMSKEAKKHVKVVTTGNAGDEIFAGYRQHLMIYYGKRYYDKFPFLFNSKLTKFKLNLIERIRVNKKIKRYFKFAKEFLPSLENESRAYRKLVYLDFNDKEKKELLNYNISEKDKFIESILNKKFDLLNKLTLIDLKYTLPDQYLLNDDKLTMANSIESRVPFLDNEMLEFTQRIPSNLKIKGLKSKYIFKKTMSKYLPKEIIKRKKYGFTAPLQDWYKKYLYETAGVLLDNSEIEKQGYFKQEYLKKLLENSKNDTEKINKIILLLTFELWHKTFIDREKVKI